MTAALIISLRESFETALIVCVMLAFLKRTESASYGRWVWAGLLAGAVFTLSLSAILSVSIRTMPEAWRLTVEGIVMIVAAVLVGWMTVWMAARSRTMRSDVEREMSSHMRAGRAVGIFLMSFLSTAREGTEMVIMVQAAILSGVKLLHAISGVVAGISGAALLAWIFFKGMRRISLRHFFAATGLILLLLGTGLSVRGIGLLDGKQAIVKKESEENFGDELLNTFFGANGEPTPLQAAGGVLYACVIGGAWYRASRKRI